MYIQNFSFIYMRNWSKRLQSYFLKVLHQGGTNKTFDENMIRGALSILTPLSQELWKQKKTTPESDFPKFYRYLF